MKLPAATVPSATTFEIPETATIADCPAVGAFWRIPIGAFVIAEQTFTVPDVARKTK
jgi:hypothetical protein